MTVDSTSIPDASGPDEGSDRVDAKPSKRGRVGRVLRITGYLLLILMFVGIAITQTDWGEQKISELAVKALHDELGLDATLGEVEVRFAFFPPEVFVHISDIDLDHPVYGDFAEAGALVIRPSLLAFLSGRVDLQRIELAAPTLHLLIEDGKIVNLPILPETGGGSTELPFSRIAIREAEVDFDAGPLGSGALRDLSLTIDADGSEMDIELDCEEGWVEHLGGRDTLQRLLFEGELDLDDEVADIERAALRTPYFRTIVRDAVVSFDLERGYTGNFFARLDLAQIERLPIEVGIPLSGVVEIEGDVRGRGAEPEGEGQVRLLDVRIDDKWGLGDEVALEIQADTHHVEIRDGSVAHLRHTGHVDLLGSIELDPDRGFPVDVSADIHALNLGALMDQLGVTRNSIVSWPMNGRGELRGTLMPLAIEGPLDIRTEDFLITIDPWHQRNGRRLLGVERGTVRGTWRYDEEAAKFINMRVDTGRSQIDVPYAHLGYDNRLRVEASGTNINLDDVSPFTTFELGGVGSASVVVSGTFDDPDVRGKTRMREFAFDTFPMGDIETDYFMRDDYLAVVFPNVQAQKNTSRYGIDDLTLDFKDERVEVSGHLRASRLTLQDVYHVFHYESDERYTPVQGVARGHMTLRYTFDFPRDGPNGTFESAMELDILGASVSDIEFQSGQFAGNLLWTDYTRGLDGADLTIDHLELRKGEGTLAIAGAIRPDQPGSPAQLHLTVSADQLAIAETEGLGDRMPELQGIYSVLGEIRGTPSVPRAHLDLSFTGLRWDRTFLGDARAYVRLTDRSDPWVREAAAWDEVPEDEPCAHARYGLARGRWRADPPVRTIDGMAPALDTPMAYLVCGEGMGGEVSIDMAVGWTDVYPLRGVIDFARMELDPILRQAVPDRDLGGNVSGRIAFTAGDMLRDGSLGGWIRLNRLRLAARDAVAGSRFRIRNQGPIDIRLERGGFRVDRARLAGPGTMLAVSGGGDARGELGMRVDGTVDLRALETLSTEIAHSGGELAVRVNVNGTVSDPTIHGDAEIARGRLLLAQIPYAEVEDLSGRIEFNRRRAEFQDFSARIAGGAFRMNGAATIRAGELRNYRFDMRLRDALLRPDEGVRMGLDGEAQLAWESGQRLPRLEGELRLARGRYNRPIQLSPTLGQLYRPQRADVERYDPDADNLEIDLRIVDRGAFRIRNNLLDLDLRIDDSDRPFRISGTDQRFGVLGRLEVERGTVRFRNTNLDVTRGEIRFNDETRLDASFDVLAETEVRRQQTSADLTAPAWRVSVRAHGNMDAFRLDASSQPQLSQEDLMLLLTVGMTSAEAQQLEAGDVGGTALEALSAIAGVNEEVTNAVQVIDEFAITTRYSPQTGRPEPMVTVGKRITDRVRLSAATGLTGSERTFQTGVEWQVGNQTSFQVLYDNINRESASSFGNVGLDFHWRLEFE